MADLEEEKFRIEFEKVARKNGWTCIHTNGIDGLHDELMFKNDLGLTVELKSVKPRKFGFSLRNDFKSTQMPFYLRQIAESKTPTWIAVKYLEETPYYGLYRLSSQKEIIDFFTKKWKDLHNLYTSETIETMFRELNDV